MSTKVLHVHVSRSNNKLVFTGDKVVLKIIEDLVESDEFTNLLCKAYPIVSKMVSK